jgi:hypothetical protein
MKRTSPSHKTSFYQALTQTTLSPLQKTILQERYITVVQGYESRCFRIAIFFHSARFIVTVGSLIVPALLSIQYVDSRGEDPWKPTSLAYQIYWTTWVLSLLVTTCNGVLSIFKVDKKYYSLHTTLEHLRSEGWQFLELTGRYSGFHTPQQTATHSNQFVFFCHSVEKIKMKQVEEEYYKLSDHTTSQNSAPKLLTNHADTEKKELPKDITGLIPPTPLTTLIEQAQALPPELLKQLFGQKPEDLLEKETVGNDKSSATAPPMPVRPSVQEEAASTKLGV